MKLIDSYHNLKSQHLDAIVLIKSGQFYLTYANDALILHYIFGYKKINDKVGFPLNVLDSVLDKLEKNKISYIVSDEKENVQKENNYYNYLQKANSNLITSNMCQNLINMITDKVTENMDNYNKIKDFIDEL